MNELHFALAEELERLAAGYRALAKDEINPDRITIQDISIMLTKKMQKGKISEIRGLLKKYGAAKLVEVNPETYNAFYREAKKL
jgi:ribonuclease HIII